MRIIVFLFLVSPFYCFGQKSQSEVGFGLGAMNYSGDLTQSIKPRFFRPGATAYYRLNVNDVISIKTALYGGRIVGSDEKAPVDAFAVRRNHDFGIFLFEASGVVEYHFLKWKENAYLRWTPFLFGGIGLFAITGDDVKKEYSSIQPVLPFGVGAKYVLNPRHMLEFQFGIRKTFFDYLDGVSESNLAGKNFQSGNWYDNDLYYYAGVSFTISFYDIPCPKLPYN